MGSEALGSAPPSIGRSSESEWVHGPGACTVEEVTRVISNLLGRTVTAHQVQERAIAFGLVRHPAPGERLALSAQAASRLLLAAYHCPAQFGVGGLPALYRHLRAGYLVLALLVAPPLNPALLQVCGLLRDEGGRCWFFLTEPGTSPHEGRRLPREAFVNAWAAGGNLLLVAARQWRELPTEGSGFFGGSRSADGTYHWDTAECDTDREGRILRY